MAELLEGVALAGFDPASFNARLHRNNACFGCPIACTSFFMTTGDPAAVSESEIDEPGCLAVNPQAAARLGGLGAAWPTALEAVLRAGLDPAAAAAFLSAKGFLSAEGVAEGIEIMTRDGIDLAALGCAHFGGAAPWPLLPTLESSVIQRIGLFSNALPPRPIGADWSAFGAPEDGKGRALWWLRREAVAHVLGLCPIFVLTCPALSLADLASLTAEAAGWDDLDEARLRQCADTLILDGIRSAPLAAVSGELDVAGTQEVIAEIVEELGG